MWRPSLGAWMESDGAAFRVWAPACRAVDVVIESTERPAAHPLTRGPDGTWSAVVADARAGDRYRYRLDGGRTLPDPASRFQPDGVHGASEIVDPAAFVWADAGWRGRALDEMVFYELHVGAFSPEGTFAGVAARLPALADLGVTAIEIMPVADFPGARNWGYDGVALFAPARCYGRPDDLRRLVDAAHQLDLAVILDVVYNHLGPDGNYLSAFSPHYFTDRHQTPWGAAVNFDGEDSEPVRQFVVENACHWVHDYHVDGLRLDATHAIVDDGPRHVLAELTACVRAAAPDRHAIVVAEDHRNLNTMLRPDAEGGWGLDAVWADGFHHQCRRMLAGDAEGYFLDYTGQAEDLATTIRRGWFYTGQFSSHLGRPRGTDPTGIAAPRFVFCLQNHDQIGNRAFGDRLHHVIDPAAYRAASVVLLTAPETPLLFMGQEWAAGTPFQYFTDHHEELGRLVTEGRRREFKYFSAFADPEARARIPDPQAAATFEASRLDWTERDHEPHAAMLRLYRALLALRRREPALRADAFHATAIDDGTIAIRRDAPAESLLAIARLTGAGVVDLDEERLQRPDAALAAPEAWEMVLSSESADYSPTPLAPDLDVSVQPAKLRFLGPSAVILRARLR